MITQGNRHNFGKNYKFGTSKKYSNFGTTPQKMNKNLYDPCFEREMLGKHGPNVLSYGEVKTSFDKYAEKHSCKTMPRFVREFQPVPREQLGLSNISAANYQKDQSISNFVPNKFTSSYFGSKAARKIDPLTYGQNMTKDRRYQI